MAEVSLKPEEEASSSSSSPAMAEVSAAEEASSSSSSSPAMAEVSLAAEEVSSSSISPAMAEVSMKAAEEASSSSSSSPAMAAEEASSSNAGNDGNCGKLEEAVRDITIGGDGEGTTTGSDCVHSSGDYNSSERSKTERDRHKHILPREAGHISDGKIYSQKKSKKLVKVLAAHNVDGIIHIEVPGAVEPQVNGVESERASCEVVEEISDGMELQDFPPMQIVMLIVGTRGDVQPFVAIGKRLQDLGHRVRLATHANFKAFVLTAGLEFYPLGGDPKVIAGYMVKTKGFLPKEPSEISTQTDQTKEIINSLPPACKEPDVDSGIPFKADAIIANPPAYGHTHVAEALKIPIHIFFTMPWTKTSEFPHPLSRVNHSAGYKKSYGTVDSWIWLGIQEMINDFRKKKLKLKPVSYSGGSKGSKSKIPHAYIWSPRVVPKPKDWGPKVDVVGFCFLDLASDYVPPESLVKWLEAGPKPIYIGFGSLPVQEPEKMIQIIIEALEITKQRGIINKGWGGLGNLAEPKDSVYLLDNVPHDWLFLKCAAVVHHGGAGTTAAGLKAACPTTIVPFFGDQLFWGKRVHARGVGPPPIPVDEFSLPKLVDAIKFMLDSEVKESAVKLAKAIKDEDGVEGAVKAFFKHFRKIKVEEHPTSSFFSIKSASVVCVVLLLVLLLITFFKYLN